MSDTNKDKTVSVAFGGRSNDVSHRKTSRNPDVSDSDDDLISGVSSEEEVPIVSISSLKQGRCASKGT